MKTNGKIGSIIIAVLVIYAVSGFYLYNNYVKNQESKESSSVVAIVTPDELLQHIQEKQLEIEAEQLANTELERVEVYDGLTMEELSDKLNRSLNSTLAGKGELFANSLSKGFICLAPKEQFSPTEKMGKLLML